MNYPTTNPGSPEDRGNQPGPSENIYMQLPAPPPEDLHVMLPSPASTQGLRVNDLDEFDPAQHGPDLTTVPDEVGGTEYFYNPHQADQTHQDGTKPAESTPNNTLPHLLRDGADALRDIAIGAYVRTFYSSPIDFLAKKINQKTDALVNYLEDPSKEHDITRACMLGLTALSVTVKSRYTGSN